MEPTRISGTTEECAQHFFATTPWEQTQATVAEFTAVGKDTVRQWKLGTMPKGNELLRLRVLLRQSSYTVAEFEALDPPVQRFALAVALNVIDVTEAAEMLGFKHTRELYRLLLRAQRTMRFRFFRIERYVEKSRDEIDAAAENLRQRLARLVGEGNQNDPTIQSLTPVSEPWDNLARTYVEEAELPGENQPTPDLDQLRDILGVILGESNRSRTLRGQLRSVLQESGFRLDSSTDKPQATTD